MLWSRIVWFDLTNISPVESKTSDGHLEVGETWTYTYSYTVTQADMDAGFALNKVISTTEEIPEDKTTEHRISSEPTPALTVEKSVEETSFDAVGDTLTYTVVLTNTGNMTLTDIDVIDSLVDLSQITPDESLAKDGRLEVGETWTYTYEYEVTGADLTAGVVVNRVSVTTKETPDPISDETSTGIVPKPNLEITKHAVESVFNKAGDTLHYTVVLKNVGNVALKNVVVTDSLVDLQGLPPVESISTDRVLAIGETWTYTYSYTVNQVDVDKKQVVNMVHAKTDELPDGVETTLTISLSSKPVPPEEKSSDVPKTGESGTNLGGGLMLLLLALALIVWKKRKVNCLLD